MGTQINFCKSFILIISEIFAKKDSRNKQNKEYLSETEIKAIIGIFIQSMMHMIQISPDSISEFLPILSQIALPIQSSKFFQNSSMQMDNKRQGPDLENFALEEKAKNMEESLVKNLEKDNYFSEKKEGEEEGRKAKKKKEQEKKEEKKAEEEKSNLDTLELESKESPHFGERLKKKKKNRKSKSRDRSKDKGIKKSIQKAKEKTKDKEDSVSKSEKKKEVKRKADKMDSESKEAKNGNVYCLINTQEHRELLRQFSLKQEYNNVNINAELSSLCSNKSLDFSYFLGGDELKYIQAIGSYLYNIANSFRILFEDGLAFLIKHELSTSNLSVHQTYSFQFIIQILKSKSRVGFIFYRDLCRAEQC